MKCKLSEKCEFGNLCKDATRHDSLTVLGCSSFKTKEPMTNEEYLRSANVNDMARCIATKLLELAKHEYGIYDVVDYATVFEWLKEIHNDNA